MRKASKLILLCGLIPASTLFAGPLPDRLSSYRADPYDPAQQLFLEATASGNSTVMVNPVMIYGASRVDDKTAKDAHNRLAVE